MKKTPSSESIGKDRQISDIEMNLKEYLFNFYSRQTEVEQRDEGEVGGHQLEEELHEIGGGRPISGRGREARG